MTSAYITRNRADTRVAPLSMNCCSVLSSIEFLNILGIGIVLLRGAEIQCPKRVTGDHEPLWTGEVPAALVGSCSLAHQISHVSCTVSSEEMMYTRL